MRRFPRLSQWKQIAKILSDKEKIFLLVFLSLAIISFGFLTINFYLSHTKIVPTLGGEYKEGVVGQPRFINPIYSEASDIDRTLTNLVFSSLITYDREGNIVNDLVQSWKVSDDGRTYTFRLKENIFWHDGKALTADDVIFTITTIQNAEYKSPLRANWIDVDAQKISDQSIAFILKVPYNSFLENLTVKILPKHIWESIPPENFGLSLYNLQPIGSGPFAFESIRQTGNGFIKTIHFSSYRKYHQQPAHIAKLSFHFFEKKESLIQAANARTIHGFPLSALDNNQREAEEKIRQGWTKQDTFAVYSFSLPRYFAAFFNNQKSSIFSDSKVRSAMEQALDKESLLKIIQEETGIRIAKVDSPILPDFFSFAPPSKPKTYDPTQAENLLNEAGFKKNPSGQREKTTVKQPAFQFKSYLKIGSKGKEVAELQSCLKRLPDANFSAILQNENPETYGKATDSAVIEFQKKYLPTLKPTGETGSATRTKLNELCVPPLQNSQPLAFTITTINQPQLLIAAEYLQKSWQALGAKVEINAVSAAEVKTLIKARNYDTLLYGEVLGAKPDLYPFWHSSQRIDPGLNLSSYENKDVDQLLKEARETMDEAIKRQKYEKLQNIILSDTPAIFLYNPEYGYWSSRQTQGISPAKIIDPSRRFVDITNWYIKTKRIWK